MGLNTKFVNLEASKIFVVESFFLMIIFIINLIFRSMFLEDLLIKFLIFFWILKIVILFGIFLWKLAVKVLN